MESTSVNSGGGTIPQMEQFLLQAKSAKQKEAAALIEQALEANGVYVFGELLDMPNIQELANGEHARHLALLKLFAFGTYGDYKGSEDKYPSLSEPMIRKLRHLTVASLASENRSLLYSHLMNELGLTNRRQLEDLVIEAIYADVLRGKLDQRNSRLDVERVLARDVPGDLAAAVRLMEEWCSNCEGVLKTIENEADKADRHKQLIAEQSSQLENKISSAINKASQYDDTCMQSDDHKYKLKLK